MVLNISSPFPSLKLIFQIFFSYNHKIFLLSKLYTTKSKKSILYIQKYKIDNFIIFVLYAVQKYIISYLP